MKLSDDFAFTQSSLGDYVDCARRFELRYIRRMRYPALEVQQALDYEARIRQGDRFHKLLQQHLSGVPAAVLERSLAVDGELRRWWDNALTQSLADLPQQRHAEITLQTFLAGRRLLAKYDLLALDPGGEAVIVDWKTGGRLPSRLTLERRLQTVAYRYVLASAGGHLYGGPIPPERIRMDYVYVAAGGERISFRYSAEELAADETWLADMIRLAGQSTEFPLTEDERRCRFCSYRSYCGRGEAGRLDELEFDVEEAEAADEDDFDLDFDQVSEIEF